jgi:hypothetical protein
VQRHTKPVHSVCWDVSGDFLASVIEDSVQVWNLGMGSDGECIYELNCNGNNFHACVFHPNFRSLLFIGCFQVSISEVCATQCMPDTNLFLALSAASGMSAMYYGMYRPLCPVRCLWGIWATQSFRTGSKTGTQWPVPSTPHNMIFSWFAQWACGFWTIGRPGRPKKTCPLCLVRGLRRGRKGHMKTIMCK